MYSSSQEGRVCWAKARRGFQAERSKIRALENSWVGGSHEVSRKNLSLAKLLLQASCEGTGVGLDTFHKGDGERGKNEGKKEGSLQREKPHRMKGITPFASIIPPLAGIISFFAL